jgi:hypothetical protein
VQQSAAGYNENPASPNLPTLQMGNEDYGRIYRIATIDHIPVVLRVNIKSEFYPSGNTVYNVVGELPGTDKADEVVMAGGHFDSWNPATGATGDAGRRVLPACRSDGSRSTESVHGGGSDRGSAGFVACAEHIGQVTGLPSSPVLLQVSEQVYTGRL